MNTVSHLEVFFEGVPPEKKSLAAHFKGMAQAALAQAPDDPVTRELVDDYLGRAVRALEKGCVVALAQGAAGATGIRPIETSYQGSLGQEIKVREVIAHAAPVIEPGREDRSHQVVFAKGLHSPEAKGAIEAHARHLAADQGFGRREEVKYSPGGRSLVERAVNAVVGRPVLGTVLASTDEAAQRQAADSIAANFRYDEGQRLVEQVNPAPVDRGLVQAEISAMHQAAAAAEQRAWEDVRRLYDSGGALEGKCLIDP